MPSAATAELQFGDSATRYSYADWERKQQAEPTCHVAMRYIVLGRPLSLPSGLLSCFPSYQRPSFSEILELADKGRLHPTDDGIVLLVRQPAPQTPSDLQHPLGRAACLLNDEPVRICTTALPPLGHAGWSFDSFLLLWHHAHAVNARFFFTGGLV